MTTYSNIYTMTSLINTAYPIAGQDNDSQGFRDNFTNISNLFVEASSEIGDLQVNGARKDSTQDYQYNILQNTVLQSIGKSYQENGSATAGVSGNIALNFSSGNYQKIWVKDVTSVSANWISGNANPMNQTMRIEVQLSADSTSTATVNFVGSPSPWQPTGGGRTSFPYSVNGTPAVWEWSFSPNTDGNTLLTFIGQYTA